MIAQLLYVDTSALLDRALLQKDHEHVHQTMRSHLSSGGDLVSSRLLQLEARRVRVREANSGADNPAAITQLAALIQALPLTDDVWARAHAIEHHVKTLDSIHLATCAEVGATLLSTDARMNDVARLLGIDLVTRAWR